MDQIVRQILQENGDNEGDLRREIDLLAGRHGDEVYREVFRHLFKRDIDAPRAGRYWREALARWSSMDRVKGGILRVRSALLDYLHSVIGENLGSVNDGLTGLYNWPYTKHYADKLLVYLRRRGGDPSLALVLFELDHFQRYSEMGGPLEGDRTLRSVAKILTRHTREMDVVARHESGGFALILPGSDRTRAFAAAERIRRAVEISDFPGQGALPGAELTLSCGIAAFPEDGDSVHSLSFEAERELAVAKETGNRTCPQMPERRRDHRRKVFSVVEVATGAQTPYFTAMALDVSRGGIALGCDTALAPGSDLRLRFRRPFWPQEREIVGTVRQVREDQTSGLLHAGLEFVAPQNGLCPAVTP